MGKFIELDHLLTFDTSANKITDAVKARFQAEWKEYMNQDQDEYRSWRDQWELIE